MTIDEFKNTTDYRDICYMIKHIPFASTRCTSLKELGYKIVPIIIKNEKKEIRLENIFYDKNGNIIMQITNKLKNKTMAWAVKILQK